jgi:hypothetical protein
MYLAHRLGMMHPTYNLDELSKPASNAAPNAALKSVLLSAEE